MIINYKKLRIPVYIWKENLNYYDCQKLVIGHMSSCRGTFHNFFFPLNPKSLSPKVWNNNLFPEKVNTCEKNYQNVEKFIFTRVITVWVKNIRRSILYFFLIETKNQIWEFDFSEAHKFAKKARNQNFDFVRTKVFTSNFLVSTQPIAPNETKISDLGGGGGGGSF